MSLNLSEEVVHEVVSYRTPADILKELAELEKTIQKDMKELSAMLAIPTRGRP